MQAHFKIILKIIHYLYKTIKIKNNNKIKK